MRSPWRKLAAGLTMALGAAVAALVPPAQAATGIIIAIDPGHGGSDPGAVANGLQEKDLTLAVSLALKEELETYDGVTVVMTRTSDTRPSENLSDDLSSRVQMAAAADADALVLPGGGPMLNDYEGLKKAIVRHYEAGRLVAAICAAPLVLGGLGLLRGRRATCYPGFEQYLTGATVVEEATVREDNIITGRGPGMVYAFGVAVVDYLMGMETADEVARGLLLKK